MRGAAERSIDAVISSIEFLLTRLMRGAALKALLICVIITDFYSRASCEARHIDLWNSIIYGLFLLTRLMRGAATPKIKGGIPKIISTHAPHARRGYAETEEGKFQQHFYSRASCEARPYTARAKTTCLTFLLTRLMRGAAN